MSNFDASLVNVLIGIVAGGVIAKLSDLFARRGKREDELNTTLKNFDAKLDLVVTAQELLSQRVSYLEKPRRRWYG